MAENTKRSFWLYFIEYELVQIFYIMRINTERLLLAEFTLDDLNNIHELHSFPEVDKYNTLGIPATIEETKNYLQTLIADQLKDPRSNYVWTISKSEDNSFVGIAGMNVSNNKFRLGEIYYKIHPAQWENGFAT